MSPLKNISSLESNSERRSEMIASLESHLDEDAKGLGPIARLDWLVSHIEDYLHRWIAALEYFTMGSLVHSDFHWTLKIGVEITEREQALLPGCDSFKETWRQFSISFHKIGEETSKDAAKELLEHLESIRLELDSLKQEDSDLN